MYANKRRSPTLAGIYDFNNVTLRENNANINTKNYLLSKPPMSYRDLRFVVTNRIPSNLLILPKTLSCSETSINIPILPKHKKEHKLNRKQTSHDIYRPIGRSTSYYSTHFERDTSNDELTPLTSSLSVDRIAPLTSSTLFRTQNLPKLPNKHKDKQKTNEKRPEHVRTAPTEMSHRTTQTVIESYEEDNDKITSTTRVLSCMPKDRNRKQLHVYVPTINC